MDKWDEAVAKVQNGILAEEPEAAVAGVCTLFAEFGRTLEMISTDLDRIATAFEAQKVDITGPAEPPVHDL